MKAIRVHKFGEPDVMQLEEMPDTQPGPKQVVVRVHAVGVNPNDTYVRAGTIPGQTLPYTPGLDAAGVVESVGEGVSQVAVGDKVYTAWPISGSYAELALYDESQVYPLPEQISYSQGAAVNTPYATAYRALFQLAKAIPGDVVLVHGASGGVGIAAVQLARAAGLTVIGTGGSERGRQLVAEQGAHHVLDHSAPGYLEQAQALTNGHGMDVVLEMSPAVNLGKDLNILANGGRVVLVGNRGKAEINFEMMARNISIWGLKIFDVSAEEVSSIRAAIFAGLENGTLRPVVSQEIPLAEAPRAHRAVMESGSYGKIVLIP